jgi:hypothetical protein
LDDECEEVAREVNYNVFVISSNTRCDGHNAYSYMAYSLQNRRAFSIMVVHVASDAFVGTVVQVITVNINL